MKCQVTIRAAAHSDLRHARDWYERQRTGLGQEFLLAIADSMLAIEQGTGAISGLLPRFSPRA